MVLGGAGSQVLNPPEPAKSGECQALHFHYGGGKFAFSNDRLGFSTQTSSQRRPLKEIQNSAEVLTASGNTEGSKLQVHAFIFSQVGAAGAPICVEGRFLSSLSQVGSQKQIQ
jgi:hypothetical protein